MRSFTLKLTAAGLVFFTLSACTHGAFDPVVDARGLASVLHFKHPQVEVCNLETEKKIGPKPVHAVEWVIDIDRAAKTFRTAGHSNRKFLFRKVGFDGEVKESTSRLLLAGSPPPLKPPTVNSKLRTEL